MAIWANGGSVHEQLMADPIDRLVRDHRKLMNLMYKLTVDEADGPDMSAEEILRELEEELELHSRLEEALFQPAFGESDGAAQRAMYEHRREHDEVNEVVESLRRVTPNSREFVQRAKQLETYIAEHAEQEEAHLFPQLRELLSEQELDAIGASVPERPEND